MEHNHKKERMFPASVKRRFCVLSADSRHVANRVRTENAKTQKEEYVSLSDFGKRWVLLHCRPVFYLKTGD